MRTVRKVPRRHTPHLVRPELEQASGRTVGYLVRRVKRLDRSTRMLVISGVVGSAIIAWIVVVVSQ